MLGKGLVAMIENTSDRYLTVVLSVRNPPCQAPSASISTLSPNPKRFRASGGWQFVSGDELALFNDEFGALRLTVP